MLARTHLISEVSVLTFNWNVAFFMRFVAHRLLALAQAGRVALHVAGVAEGGGVGGEVRVLEQGL